MIEKIGTQIQKSLSCPLRGYLLGKVEAEAELSPVPCKHRITPKLGILVWERFLGKTVSGIVAFTLYREDPKFMFPCSLGSP